jgi:hypothetical protein
MRHGKVLGAARRSKEGLPVSRSAEERRLRRHAARQGLRVERSPARREWNPEYGLYRVADAATGNPVIGIEPGGLAFSLHLEDVAAFLEAYKTR